jgi:tetratricopeptide (TPR) repeat protein
MKTIKKLAYAAELPVVTNKEEHYQIYKHGTDLIYPHIQLHGQHPKINAKAKRDLAEGIACMKAVVSYNPVNWAAFWILGKAQQALGEQKLEYESFKAAFDIQKEWPDVAREYAWSCLKLGLGEDAVIATKHAISLSPHDAGLQANLAVAYLAIGKNDEADAAISKSLEMDPDDNISQAVRKLIDDVFAGKKPRTKKKQGSQKR